MNRPVLFLPPATVDVAQAISWYNRQAFGLGRAFLSDLNRQVRRIEHFPSSYPRLGATCRRANLHRFPYVIVYRVLPSSIEVIAVLPHQLDPERISRRISTLSD